jgi:hypothetical protein
MASGLGSGLRRDCREWQRNSQAEGEGALARVGQRIDSAENCEFGSASEGWYHHVQQLCSYGRPITWPTRADGGLWVYRGGVIPSRLVTI